jgi:hypothetical protein
MNPTVRSRTGAYGVIERAARFPFVIFDVHLTEVEWWRADSKPPEKSRWLATVSEQLVSETLVFVWLHRKVRRTRRTPGARHSARCSRVERGADAASAGHHF